MRALSWLLAAAWFVAGSASAATSGTSLILKSAAPSASLCASGQLGLNFGLTGKACANGLSYGASSGLPGWTFSRTGAGFGMYGGASQSFSAGTPRILGGVLELEAANTNLVTTSEQPSFSLVNATQANSSTVGPTGGTTFYKLCTSTSNGGYCQKNTTIPSDTNTYAASIFVLKTQTSQTFRANDLIVSGNSSVCDFDLSTGIVSLANPTTVNSVSNCIVEDWGAAWRLTNLLANTSHTTFVQESLAAGASTTGAAQIGGLQVNLGTAPGSYIPTTSVAVTRNAEALTVSIPASGYYSVYTADPAGSAWSTPASLASPVTITPRTGQYLLTKQAFLPLDRYDTFQIADTVAGAAWTSTDGLTTTPCAAPLTASCIASPIGSIAGHLVTTPIGTTAAANTAVYFVATPAGGKVLRHLEAWISFPNSATHAGTQTGAMFSTNLGGSSNGVSNAAHMTFSNTQLLMQTNTPGHAFVTIQPALTYSNLIDGKTHHIVVDYTLAGTATACVDAACRSWSSPLFNQLIAKSMVFEDFSAPPNTLSSITFSGTMATATCPAACGFANGQQVTIAGATGADAVDYNGVFTIGSAGIAATTFTYVMPGTPAGNAVGTLVAANQYQMNYVAAAASYAAQPVQ